MFTFSIGNLIWATINIVALIKIYLLGMGLAFSIIMVCDHIVNRAFNLSRIVLYSLLSHLTVFVFIKECIEILWDKYKSGCE